MTYFIFYCLISVVTNLAFLLAYLTVSILEHERRGTTITRKHVRIHMIIIFTLLPFAPPWFIFAALSGWLLELRYCYDPFLKTLDEWMAIIHTR